MTLLLDRKRKEMEKGVKIADVDMLYVERNRVVGASYLDIEDSKEPHK
jgi:hypothetical protein